VHILDADGHPVSFCEFNAINRPRMTDSPDVIPAKAETQSVIPAKAGIHLALDLKAPDSGSTLRFARNDELKRVSLK